MATPWRSADSEPQQLRARHVNKGRPGPLVDARQVLEVWGWSYTRVSARAEGARHVPSALGRALIRHSRAKVQRPRTTARAPVAGITGVR